MFPGVVFFETGKQHLCFPDFFFLDHEATAGTTACLKLNTLTWLTDNFENNLNYVGKNEYQDRKQQYSYDLK